MSEEMALVKEGRGICLDLANLAAFRANPKHLLSIDTPNPKCNNASG